ncbi:hypothetical protein E2562_024511 [Oryza meyeriana var. granulata]|uniref:NAC domain-containing protein n=1 Tax=Oryza meyeriana var. granulata TaxID=110450 RepID=A0A6G1BN54_9ORYZ|nr:hypothetical protein E2562_024511 [Oryza meyeriana var. granulata]
MVMSGGARSDPLATPGFRFYPTEEELLAFYLRHRLAGTRTDDVARVIPVVDVYSYHPSQLRSMAGEVSVRDKEQWFFFCPRAERELHGGRPARTTPSGYWKATGSPSLVFSAATSRVIGVKRTMVFYQGRAPTGTKTRWKMNEYKAVVADDEHTSSAAVLPPMAPPPPPNASSSSYACVRLRNELSVCRVYIGTGTLRSFDRRPLDTPSAGHDHRAVFQQQRHVADVVPSAEAAVNASLAGVVVAGTQAEYEYEYEYSHGSSATSSEDAAIDLSSLIAADTTAGDFSFNEIDFSSGGVGPWPQTIPSRGHPLTPGARTTWGPPSWAIGRRFDQGQCLTDAAGPTRPSLRPFPLPACAARGVAPRVLPQPPTCTGSGDVLCRGYVAAGDRAGAARLPCGVPANAIYQATRPPPSPHSPRPDPTASSHRSLDCSIPLLQPADAKILPAAPMSDHSGGCGDEQRQCRRGVAVDVVELGAALALADMAGAAGKAPPRLVQQPTTAHDYEGEEMATTRLSLQVRNNVGIQSSSCSSSGSSTGRPAPPPPPPANAPASSSGYGGPKPLHMLTEEEKEAKRLRRVLANRESARQTILRRQERETVMQEYLSLKETNKQLKEQAHHHLSLSLF